MLRSDVSGDKWAPVTSNSRRAGRTRRGSEDGLILNVHPDEAGRAAQRGDGVEGHHGGVGVDRVGDDVAERLAGELVGDVQDLDGPPCRGDFELVVEGPDLVRAGARQPVGWRRRDAEALALVASRTDAKTLLTPETLHLLPVEATSLPDEHCVRPPVARAWMSPREVAKLSTQVVVRVCHLGKVALGRAVLADELARPPLREACRSQSM